MKHTTDNPNTKKNTVKAYLDSLPKGAIITNLRVLSAMKRSGLIFGYDNPGGYLNNASPVWVDENGHRHSMGGLLYLFPNGHAPKEYDQEYNSREELIKDLDWPNDLEIEYKGHKFRKKYLDGCFCPYLQKVSGNDDNAVNPRMSVFGCIV